MSTELAWAAGFFDGEGCVAAYVRKDGHRTLGAQVGQTDPRPLQRLRAVVREGRVYGPYARPDHPKWSSVWSWRVIGYPATTRVMTLLWPYLSEPKREQWARAIEKYGVPVSRVEALAQNRRGHAA